MNFMIVTRLSDHNKIKKKNYNNKIFPEK